MITEGFAMALIKCPECGNDVSDKAKKCPKCGYKLKRKIKNDKRKVVLVITAIVIFAVLCGVGGYYGYNYYLAPKNYYNKAMGLLEDENYEEAVEEFSSAGGYKDASEKYDYYFTLMNHYNKAMELLEDDRYEEAVEEFSSAGEYKDASEKINETKYEWAGDSSLEKSIELYRELGDYKDSKDRLADVEREKEKQSAIGKMISVCSKCKSKGTSLSSDKKSIMVDSDGKFDFDATEDVMVIIDYLGLPDSLFDEMCQTNALMGRQTETYDCYEVSWSYHPDNGLDVVFKLVD